VGVGRVPAVGVNQGTSDGRTVITYFERLRVPVAHSADGRHLVEAIGEFIEFLHAVCQSYGKFFGKEL